MTLRESKYINIAYFREDWNLWFLLISKKYKENRFFLFYPNLKLLNSTTIMSKVFNWKHIFLLKTQLLSIKSISLIIDCIELVILYSSDMFSAKAVNYTWLTRVLRIRTILLSWLSLEALYVLFTGYLKETQL